MHEDVLGRAANDPMPMQRQDPDALPVAIPEGHIGPVILPGTGRMIWWTGRVAIGLRHEPDRRYDAVSQSALWVQNLMLGGRWRAAA